MVPPHQNEASEYCVFRCIWEQLKKFFKGFGKFYKALMILGYILFAPLVFYVGGMAIILWPDIIEEHFYEIAHVAIEEHFYEISHVANGHFSLNRSFFLFTLNAYAFFHNSVTTVYASHHLYKKEYLLKHSIWVPVGLALISITPLFIFSYRMINSEILIHAGFSGILFATALLVLFMLMEFWRAEHRQAVTADTIKILRVISFVYFPFLALGLLTIFLFGIFFPIIELDHLNTLQLYLFFILLAGIVISTLNYLFNRWTWSLTGLILFLYIFSSYTGGNAYAPANIVMPQPSISSVCTKNDPDQKQGIYKSTHLKQLANWLSHRRDLDKWKGKAYPVYLIAAPGGGVYSSYHVALALARFAANKSNFLHHVYIASGVSGGSLGINVFLSLNTDIKSDNCIDISKQRPKFEKRLDNFFSIDFMRPIIRHGLYFDLPLKFLPLQITPGWVPRPNRGGALAREFEKQARKHLYPTGSKLGWFDTDIVSSWSPNSNLPAVIVNAVDVQHGSVQMLHAKSFLYPSSDRPFHTFKLNRKVAISSAISIGSRFPIISPPATFITNDKFNAQLVDGGYYENSGAGPLLAIVEDISKKDYKITINGQLHEIVLKILTFKMEKGKMKNRDRKKDELIVPVSTFLNARKRRGEETIAVLTDIVGEKNILVSTVSDCDDKLKLGWFLSKSSKKIIADSPNLNFLSRGVQRICGKLPPLTLLRL